VNRGTSTLAITTRHHLGPAAERREKCPSDDEYGAAAPFTAILSLAAKDSLMRKARDQVSKVEESLRGPSFQLFCDFLRLAHWGLLDLVGAYSTSHRKSLNS
jgi:hypothetical protein